MVLDEINQKAFAGEKNAVWLNVAGETLRYSEQILRLEKLKLWLFDNKVKNKDLVLVAVQDDLERMSLLMAMISIGQPILIFDPAGTQYETDLILSECSFSAVIAEEFIYQELNLFTYGTPYLQVAKRRKNTGVFGRLLGAKPDEDSRNNWPALTGDSFSSDLAEGSERLTVSSNDLAYVVFTSGTTSKPKGVEIEYGALLSQLTTLERQYKLNENSRLLNTLPLHHVDGFIQGPTVSWFAGASVYRPCAFTTQNLDAYLNSIYRERITHMISVPTMLSQIYRLGREWAENFSSPDFRFIVSCAGHLELSLWESFENYFGTKIVNMYGLTETTTSALFSGPDEITRRLGTLGKPINSKIKIVDSNGDRVNQGEEGELVICSPQLMRGYHGDPDASSQILRDGWLFTGDLVKQLDTGHLELVGRKKNQIISGGKNVSPQEVAEAINLNPGVIESIVLGHVDQDWGEAVVALVVCSDKTISDVDLIIWCRSRLSEFKVPRYLFIVPWLFKGPSGKIVISKARNQFEEQMRLLAKGGAQGTSLEEKVLAAGAVAFRIDQSALDMYSSPENTIGWDSLAHMSFVVELEQTFGIELSARDIMKIGSIHEAVEVCRRKL